MSTEKKELSKNELKKLAKKAEKEAKKQALKQQAQQGQPPSAAAPPSEPSAKTASAGATSAPSQAAAGPPSLQLANAYPENCLDSLKVVYAAQVFGVELTPANSQTDKLTLLYGNECSIVGDGNAMVQAIAGMSAVKDSLLDSSLVDDACEWERTCLRQHVGTDHLQAPLAHLEERFQSHAAPHYVGTTDTAADVCIIPTLSTIPDAPARFPPAVAHYYQAHASSLQVAQEALAQNFGKKTTTAEVDMSEPSLFKVLEQVWGHVVASLYGDDLASKVPPAKLAMRCKDAKLGDYQCAAAMQMLGLLKKSGQLPAGIQKPQQLAQTLVDALGTDHPVVYQVQANEAGFILYRIRPSFLQHHINALLKNNMQLPKPHGVTRQVCTVDFSSPNIAKEMHVGHLRSTIIGEAVCRILEFVGHDVHRINHVGDWGTQFGMLIQYLKEEYPEVGQQGTSELPNITDLTEFYKSAKARFDESPEFKKTAQTNVVKLQSGDEECRKIWKLLCDVSRREFQRVYNRLDVTVEECGESFYNDKIPPVIDEFVAAKKIKIEEGGAKCVFVDKFKIPLMLQKSDGGYGYDSTDMAALKYRLQVLKADRVICITDYTQGDHFAMVYAAGRDIGWPDRGQRLEHIGFGTVQGEDGKRFKTRSGDTVRLVDLLDEAVSRMEAQLLERIQEGKANITRDEVHGVAEAIGYGAVKYYDLSQKPTSGYKFSYDQMLSTKGNTAVYLLYSRVRLESICAKAKADFGVDVEELQKSGTESIVLGDPAEVNLALYLQLFTDTLEQTLDDLFPYHICDYVYDLSIAATNFVTKCKVLGTPEMKSRLLLCYVTAAAMHQCFDLLGIRHVKRI